MVTEEKVIVEVNLPGLKLTSKANILKVGNEKIAGRMTYQVNDHEVDYWSVDRNNHILILYNKVDIENFKNATKT